MANCNNNNNYLKKECKHLHKLAQEISDLQCLFPEKEKRLIRERKFPRSHSHRISLVGFCGWAIAQCFVIGYSRYVRPLVSAPVVVPRHFIYTETNRVFQVTTDDELRWCWPPFVLTLCLLCCVGARGFPRRRRRQAISSSGGFVLVTGAFCVEPERER